jgi:predicted  nucleic acid-binding Zn-ribbon protein
MKLEKNRLIQESEEYREKYESQKSEKDQLQEKCDMLEMEIRDFEKERELAAKRFSSEMKEIRETMAKEIKVRTKLQE